MSARSCYTQSKACFHARLQGTSHGVGTQLHSAYHEGHILVRQRGGKMALDSSGHFSTGMGSPVRQDMLIWVPKKIGEHKIVLKERRR